MKLLREKGAISMLNHVLFISETIPLADYEIRKGMHSKNKNKGYVD